MKQYIELVKHVLNNGFKKDDRTGTGTLGVFGYQMRFDLNSGFPLVTTKHTPFKLVLSELLWFLAGKTNINELHIYNNHIWDEWANQNGDLGPIYGYQWRSWPTSNNTHIDQIKQVVDQIKQSPNSRRLIVSAWNPEFLPHENITPQDNVDIGKMALPPCHTMFQFYVIHNKLSCQLYQRSADICLGVPFNIASYALLTHMIAKECNLGVGDFIHTLGDAHIYINHIDNLKKFIHNTPYDSPKIWLNPNINNIFEYKIDDIRILDYKHHKKVHFEIAV